MSVKPTENSPPPQVDPLLLNYDENLEGHAGEFVDDEDLQDYDIFGLYDSGLVGSGQAGVPHRA